jgi:hypothetical protein
MPSGRSSRPIAERFWEKTRFTPSGCWEWQATIQKNGYGHFMRSKRKPIMAHRMAYELAYGSIPEGLHVLHRCDNRRCVRPDHLWVGTHSDNMRDMHAKGRGRTGPKRRERCGKGHAPNWYINPNTGRRCCRSCQAVFQRARRERMKAA